VEYGGAIYHVMNRGDRPEPIFQDDADRRRFVETLASLCAEWLAGACDAGDDRLDCTAIADGKRGQREHAAL
jgi:hypothetical protein